MAVIISDTGPLLALAGIEQLGILQALFKQVLIPTAVWRECQAQRDVAALAIAQARQQGWLTVKTVAPPQDFPVCLGDGEQEAMQLAAEYPKPLLIMDDRLARREALQRQLNFVGTVKILWVAQQRGVIADAVSVLDAMAANGYYLSRQLLEQVSKTGTDLDDGN